MLSLAHPRTSSRHKLRGGADRARDLARRRDGRRHADPRQLGQQGLRRHLRRRQRGHRRRRPRQRRDRGRLRVARVRRRAAGGARRARSRAVDGVELGRRRRSATRPRSRSSTTKASGSARSQGGPPHIAASVQPRAVSSFTYIDGDAPATDDEVAIDSITAEEEDYEVGDADRDHRRRGPQGLQVSAIFEFGTGVPLGGASIAVFTLPEAQRITDKIGEYRRDPADRGDRRRQPRRSSRDRIDAVLPANGRGR